MTAPPDSGREVTKFLNENYKGRLDWKIWSGGLSCLITQLVPIRFLSVEVHEFERVSQG
jgi:hypothetical protein